MARSRGRPNSYRVPIEKIRENDWSLAAGRYKPLIAVAVSHNSPVEILGDILGFENKIVQLGTTLAVQLSVKK